MHVTTIGIDLAKTVFQSHAVVPSRIVLEFDDVSPSGIMLSDHAARSKT